MDITIVGQMLVRNEADVIMEAVSEIMRWVDVLVVLDGQSDDGTKELLEFAAGEYAGVGKHIEVVSEPDPENGEQSPVNLNFLRTRLQELTAEFRPDWVLSVDADEIYHMNPMPAIEVAEEMGANVVRCMVPQFWLTFDDLRRGALYEDQSVSVQERRRWYSWGHMGTFIWRWNDDLYYPERPSKRTPEMPGLNWREWQRAGPVTPVCKHYCIRTLSQGIKRAKERLERGGRWQFAKYALNWIIDEKLAWLHHYDGRGWNTTRNHDRLYDYMAGKLERTK